MAFLTAAEAIANAHAWFEQNSGWAPPDEGTLAEWRHDDVCRAPDECLVTPAGWCKHGLASWQLILDALDPGDKADEAEEADAIVSPRQLPQWPEP